ncbi:MAG: effector-binding domain-containing protein [Saprospiraceae bacterium]|jgi:effector-binding domain-containing protein
MKLLKKILIGLAIFIVLLLVLAYFLPRNMEISATGKVDAPAKYTYNILNDFKNQEKWDPRVSKDTSMTFVYGDKTLGEGAYVDYKSDSYGAGRTTRTTSKQDEQILLTTTSEDMGGASMSFDMEADGKGSSLTWGFKSEIGWPMNLMSFIFKSSMKKDMKVGISNIADIANERWAKGVYHGYQVNNELRESMHYVINRDVVPFAQADKYYTQNLQPLFLKIQKAGVKMEGFSSALVYNHDFANMTLDMATAIPIREEVAIEGAANETLEAGKVLVVDYYGDKQYSDPAHIAIDDYMRDRGLFNSYPVVEEYITDPTEEKDPSKWLTKVIYYLSE